MDNALLTINAGSSSIKFALFQRSDPIPSQPEIIGQFDGIGASQHARLKIKDKRGHTLVDSKLSPAPGHPHQAALAHLVSWLGTHTAGRKIVGVGHRVVHGAECYSQPIRLDDTHLDRLRTFIPLAPLHQPHNIAGIEAMRAALPGIPQIACFDTAFHRSQPAIAQLFALPRRITALGVRRYGFHGLSYEFIADELPRHLDSTQASGRIIVAHLGNGTSMCGMVNRKSQVTTMGFTTVDGLMMGTRSGAIDPGVLLYLMEYANMDAQALTQVLYKESGLLGVSGISQDMRELLASARPEAREAVDLFCYRIVREIGSLAAALGGLDALVFTGGIGEHAASVRAQVCQELGWLGVELDRAANANNSRCISTLSSKVTSLVLPTNEEWMLARHTLRLIA